MNLKKKAQIQKPLQEPKQASYLSVVGNLEPIRKLTVYSSSKTQAFPSLNRLTQICFQLALIGFIGSAFSYFFAVSLETEVAHRLHNLENQMKNSEDLKSYLSKAYSWQNLNTKAEKMNFVQAKKMENIPNKKSLISSILDIF